MECFSARPFLGKDLALDGLTDRHGTTRTSIPVCGAQTTFFWLRKAIQGFPIDGFGDCLSMDTLGVAGQWMNMDCSSKLAVACIRQRTFILEKIQS